MNNYGVGDIFNNVQLTDSMEGYAEFVAEQLDNASFRDMYMDTMEAHLLGGDRAAMNECGTTSTCEEGLSDLDFLHGGKHCVDGDCDNRFKATGGDLDYGGGGGSRGYGDSISRSLNMIPESDPTDAGSFFNLSKQRPSVESLDASQEIKDLISVAVPDTDLVAATEDYSVSNYENEYGYASEGYEDDGEYTPDGDADLDMLDIM